MQEPDRRRHHRLKEKESQLYIDVSYELKLTHAPSGVAAVVLGRWRVVHGSGGHEPVVESVHREDGAHARLSARLVQNVHAVTPSVTARDTSIHAHTHVAHLTKLTHSRLRSAKGAHAHAQGEGTVYATVSGSTRRCKTGGLEGENLIGSELLLVQSLLLLLKSFNLVLKSDLA